MMNGSLTVALSVSQKSKCRASLYKGHSEHLAVFSHVLNIFSNIFCCAAVPLRRLSIFSCKMSFTAASGKSLYCRFQT